MQHSKIKLLIVDDNKDFCYIVSTFMASQSGIEMTGIANNGIDALELIKQKTPDVVLLDMVMPRLDGLGVLEAFHKLDLKHTPKFIMLSAVGQDTLIQRSIALGAEYYLVKPFDFNVLLDRIKQIATAEYSTVETSMPIINSKSPMPETFSSDLEIQITDLMCALGIPAHINGYKYIREAISIYLEQNGAVAITKDLYPEVAKKYNTTPASVERGIRHAIEVAWERGQPDLSRKVFTNVPGIDRSKPTNAEFIASLSEELRLKNRKAIS